MPISMTVQQLNIEKACKVLNPFESFPEFLKYNENDLELTLYCKRKSEIDPKIIKWAFKLAERNVGPYYKKCPMGWTPKIKQKDLNKVWARYLVAVNDKKEPVAYSMFRFDLDYGCSVLYCYEMQVDESSQRKGLGAFMMKALETVAKHWNMSKLVLTVLKNNEDAVRFYQRIG